MALLGPFVALGAADAGRVEGGPAVLLPPWPALSTRNTITATTTTAAPTPAKSAALRLTSGLGSEYCGALAVGAAAGIGLGGVFGGAAGERIGMNAAVGRGGLDGVCGAPAGAAAAAGVSERCHGGRSVPLPGVSVTTGSRPVPPASSGWDTGGAPGSDMARSARRSRASAMLGRSPGSLRSRLISSAVAEPACTGGLIWPLAAA